MISYTSYFEAYSTSPIFGATNVIVLFAIDISVIVGNFCRDNVVLLFDEILFGRVTTTLKLYTLPATSSTDK